MNDQQQPPETPATTPPTPVENPAADDYPADLGDTGRKALDSERAARRDAETRIKDLEAKVSGYEHADTRRDVARRYTLTDDQAAALRGATLEDLEAHAEQLRGLFRSHITRKERAWDGTSSNGVGRTGATGIITRPGEMYSPDASQVADRIMDRGT